MTLKLTRSLRIARRMIQGKRPDMRPTPAQKKKLYGLLQKIVRLRDGDMCLRCSRTDTLQLSHIYPKGRYKLMEFIPSNCKMLCVACHLFFWHRDPIQAHEWLQTVLRPERLTKLKRMSQTYLGPFDPKLAIIELEQELQKYESRH